jgi:ketosteroid isomerase-like protein
MASSVEIHRAAHDAFNKRDWERMRSLTAETIAYNDRPRGLELGSSDEYLGWVKEWTTAFSDAHVNGPEYLEAGEYSICRWMGSGTNDGPMGPAQSVTGKTINMPFCEIMRVQNGRLTGGEIFYDQLTMLSQLGLVEAPAPA